MTTVSEIHAEIRSAVAETGMVPLWAFKQALQALARIEAGALAGLADADAGDDTLTMAQRAGIATGSLQIAAIRAAAAAETLGRFLPD